ncbi:uncharacterized protein LOC119606655 [Lucilia sericata]|uniref:uncharacterized protein LOC119606655 n=1 Tax=Lucilia sericata TaxID=13632 RepID=UPI0018A84D64|nr:uncharacterized protein LOC119606655 [Lucilia sericata]
MNDNCLDNMNMDSSDFDNTNLNHATYDNNTNLLSSSTLKNSTNYEEQQKRKRSLVWNFFEKVGLKRVRCRICNHEQNYQGTTGNILRHLKARHDLDVTLKGQQDPRNMQRINELSNMSLPLASEMNIDRKPTVLPKIRKKSVSSDTSDTLDPYNDHENNTKQENFENDMFYESMPELQEDCLEESLNVKLDDRKTAKRIKLEEDRIVAETEYFREKAAYFRMQKHFTALQAKKVKLEIEQINLNNKNLS